MKMSYKNQSNKQQYIEKVLIENPYKKGACDECVFLYGVDKRCWLRTCVDDEQCKKVKYCTNYKRKYKVVGL